MSNFLGLFMGEMALNSFNTIGFDPDPKTGEIKGRSFSDKRDRALITHDVNVRKTFDFFKNTGADFDFYFVNKAGFRKYAERGVVPWEFIRDEMKLDLSKLHGGGINGDNITVFFVGNSAADKEVMTPWTVAHRIGHAARRQYGFEQYTKWIDTKANEILEHYVKASGSGEGQRLLGFVDKAKLFNLIGTMRSARMNSIKRYFEFYYEVFAQYLNSGKVTLNRLTPRIKMGTAAYGRPKYASTKDIESVNDIIEEIERDATYYIEDALSHLIGSILVM